MTPVKGEESPTPEEAIVGQPVVCVSPAVSQLAEASCGDLFPVAEEHVPAPVEEDRIDGETFAERMTRLEVPVGSMAWRSLYIYYQEEFKRLSEGGEPAAKARRIGEDEVDDEDEVPAMVELMVTVFGRVVQASASGAIDRGFESRHGLSSIVG